MRNVLFVAFLVFIIAGCASQGGKSADIEQRDLFDQQREKLTTNLRARGLDGERRRAPACRG